MIDPLTHIQLTTMNHASQMLKTGNAAMDFMMLMLIPILVGLVLQQLTTIGNSMSAYWSYFRRKTSMTITCETVLHDGAYRFRWGSSAADDDLINAILAYLDAHPEIQKHRSHFRLKMERSSEDKHFVNDFFERMDRQVRFIPTRTFTFTWNGKQMEVFYSERDGMPQQASSGRRGEAGPTVSEKRFLTVKACDNATIREFCQTVYHDFIQTQYHDSKHIRSFVYFNVRNENRSTMRRVPNGSNKVFDTVFFPQKQHVMSVLNRFKDRKFYVDRGMPWVESFLLYGPPGCGKTSLIKAISAYLPERSIFILNLAHFKNDSEFQDALFSEEFYVDNIRVKIPFSKRIYVLEDFDTMSSVLKQRNSANSGQMPDQIAIAAASSSSKRNGKDGASSEWITGLSLSAVLNGFDGLTELSGAIVIATTNHPEVLDAAVTRDGRLTHKIELTYIAPRELQEMVEHFWQCKLEPDTFAALPPNRWTPAQIQTRVVQMMDNGFVAEDGEDVSAKITRNMTQPGFEDSSMQPAYFQKLADDLLAELVSTQPPSFSVTGK